MRNLVTNPVTSAKQEGKAWLRATPNLLFSMDLVVSRAGFEPATH